MGGGFWTPRKARYRSSYGTPMKRTIGMVASHGLPFLIALGLYLSFRVLPSINEMPLGIGRSSREGRNWIGQGGWAFVGYTALLLVVAYGLKRILLASCKTRWSAFLLFFALHRAHSSLYLVSLRT